MSEVPEKLTPAQKAARTRKQNAGKTKDRLPASKRSKDQNESRTRPEDVEGYYLLKSFADVPVWDQTPLLAMFDKVSGGARKLTKAEYARLTPEERKEHQADSMTVDLDMIGQLALALRPFAVDDQAYVEFCSGSNAMKRVMDLMMAWVGQMGESVSSES